VRAGASAETIAAETGWPLDRVIRYAGPPLAERAYVAERASSVEIRRDPSGSSTSLSDSVDGALEAMGLYPDQVQWDAWRRSDGKWVVCVTHPGLPTGTVATWTYDHSGRNLHPLDEFARRFMESGYASIEDFLGMPEVEEFEEAAEEPRPRLVAVSPAAQAVSDDEIEPAPPTVGWSPSGSLSRQPTVALNRQVASPEGSPAAHRQANAGRPTTPPIVVAREQAPPEPSAQARRTPASQIPTNQNSTSQNSTSQTTANANPGNSPGNKAKPKGKSRRASVPSWDEILFGASKPEDR
jgi:hypothetical protein